MINRKITQNLTFCFVLAFALMTHRFTFSQEPAITPDPGAVLTPPVIDPAVLASAQATEDEWLREYESRSVFDFRVAYLIEADAEIASDLMSEESLSSVLGAQIFHVWEDFSVQHELTPFQMVLIHDSIYGQVDRAWTHWAYRNQVILYGIGMPYDRYIEITGEHCVNDPNPGYASQAADWVIRLIYTWHYEDESRRIEIEPAALEGCGRRNPIGDRSMASLQHGGGSFPLKESGLPFLARKLAGDTMTYRLEGVTPAASPAE